MRSTRLQLPAIAHAKYAVAFCIPSTSPFEILDLSYVLLRFMDRYIRAGDYTRFNLVSLSYKCAPGGSFGSSFLTAGYEPFTEMPGSRLGLATPITPEDSTSPFRHGLRIASN
jgi:hypothetical protein